MTQVVNFNKAKKARARDEAKAQAAANRTRFGRTKAEKSAEALAAERARSILDGARREG